jgi:hypothetical protein
MTEASRGAPDGRRIVVKIGSRSLVSAADRFRTLATQIAALRKAGALPDADFRRLEHEWKKHRAAQGLDAFGKKRSAPATSASSHSAGCC